MKKYINQIIQGDCLSVMKGIPSNSIDTLITDPPAGKRMPSNKVIICDYCGERFIFKGGNVHFGRAKKHYCSIKCMSKSNIIHGKAVRGKDGKQDKQYRIFTNVKKRAKKNGTEFTLSISDIPKIPKRCSVLGIKIKENKLAGPLDSSPSLDRIDCLKGYVPGNVRIISNRANRLRQDATIKELELLIKDAKRMNRDFIGIEREAEYVEIIKARLSATQTPLL